MQADRPLDAISVQFHAQSIANWATALYWAENERLSAHHAEQLSNAFAQLHVAFAKLQAALAPKPCRCPADGNLIAEDGACGFCGNAPEVYGAEPAEPHLIGGV